MNESRITVDGTPLEDVLAFEHSKELARHLRTEIREIAKGCGLRRFSSTPHQRWCRPGRPMRQELMGHKTISMTARYAHLSPEHKLDALERLV